MREFQWWLIFPIIGVAFGFFSMWLKYKRRTATLDLIKAYLAQGKEPPQELMTGVKSWEETQHQGAQAWGRVITFGSLGLGFGVAYLAMVPEIMTPGRAHPFLVMSIIMAALTVGALFNVLIQRKYNASGRAVDRE